MTQKEEFIKQAVEWLQAKERTDEEIAEKIYEAVDETYQLTVKGPQLFSTLLSILKPPKSKGEL